MSAKGKSVSSSPAAGAIIVAGGSGTRMQSQTRKQYLTIAGLPILAHTLRVFVACPFIHRIVLVVPESDFHFCHTHILPISGSSTDIALAAGGQERHDSVYAGLKAIDVSNGIVVIHDAVRPFVQPATIAACVAGAHQYGACITGIPVHDTLKKNSSGVITGTIDRTDIWMAQTPQAFRYDLIRKAHEAAKMEGFAGTDDAAIVERLGHPVRIISGSRVNIKITSPEDLAFAEALASLTVSGLNVVK